MRLEGLAKAGFYPLPEEMTPYMISAVTNSDGTTQKKLLDPASGEGIALAEYANALDLTPYGCELHTERANAATDLIASIPGTTRANVINDDYINIRTPRAAFSILYLNPPYDFDEESGRVEYTWLKKLRPLLAPNGLLVWVVPQRILQDKLCQRYILSWFNKVSAFRFVNESYDAYKQVVIYGLHRKSATKPTPQQTANIRQLAAMGKNLPQHPM